MGERGELILMVCAVNEKWPTDPTKFAAMMERAESIALESSSSRTALRAIAVIAGLTRIKLAQQKFDREDEIRLKLDELEEMVKGLDSYQAHHAQATDAQRSPHDRRGDGPSTGDESVCQTPE
jgi:hypothetical protein